MAMAWSRAAVVLLCVAVGVGASASRRCCPDGDLFRTVGRRCGGSNASMALNCTMGKYLVNPETHAKDNFTVVDNHTLLVNRHSVHPDQYCVTKLEYRNGTESQTDVAFICFAETNDPQASSDGSGIIPKKTRHVVMGVLMAISVLFMLLMIAVYAALPEMRDLEGKCLVSTVVSFSIAFSMLGLLQFVGSQLANKTCAFTAFFQYFWMLSAFFWLNVVAFNLWKSVIFPPIGDRPERKLFIKYCVYGWGCPLIFLAMAIAMDHVPDEYQLLKPDFGRSTCWFHGRLETWLYFYGPIAVLIGFNVLFFVWTGWKLWRDYRDPTEIKLLSLRFKCLLYVKLFVIMGIPWIFELLSFELDPLGDSYFWFATDILNGLQGVLIFFITVVCRKRVLKGLRQHRSFGINWPKKWAAVGDQESHAILPDEDVEMSPAHAAAKILS